MWPVSKHAANMLWICSEAEPHCRGINQKLSVFRTNTNAFLAAECWFGPAAAAVCATSIFFQTLEHHVCGCRRARSIVCTGLKILWCRIGIKRQVAKTRTTKKDNASEHSQSKWSSPSGFFCPPSNAGPFTEKWSLFKRNTKVTPKLVLTLSAPTCNSIYRNSDEAYMKLIGTSSWLGPAVLVPINVPVITNEWTWRIFTCRYLVFTFKTNVKTIVKSFTLVLFSAA